MSGNKIVLDANIVLYLLNGDATLAAFLEGQQGYLSAVTELELIGYPDISAVEFQKIEAFLQNVYIVSLSSELRAFYVQLRQQYRLKLGDAVAAATALYLNLPFISADKGFSKVAELDFMLYTP